MSTYQNVFVSYARADQESVNIAANLLIAGGAKVFMDVRDLEFGDRWADVLMQKLKMVERVLVFWCKKAASSKWVAREYKSECAVTLSRNTQRIRKTNRD